MKRAVLFVLATAALALSGIVGFVYSGIYNVAGDRPHWAVTAQFLELVRERSIKRQAENIRAPDLKSQQLILKGAGQYAAMCVECHLAPGKRDSEIRPGLYPKPPNLSQVRIDPKNAFWVIKHGIKMTAMPAWGVSHDDDTIWSIVAFINKLPDLSPEAYRELVAKAPPDEEMESMDSPSKRGGHKHTEGQPGQDTTGHGH